MDEGKPEMSTSVAFPVLEETVVLFFASGRALRLQIDMCLGNLSFLALMLFANMSHCCVTMRD